MSKRKKWFFSMEEYEQMKNSVTVPATVRNSLAVKFLRAWQPKLEELIKLANSDDAVLERVSQAINLISGYEDALKLTKVVKTLRKALKL